MFYHDKRTQYTVRVDNPNPLYAKMLQQALGGIEDALAVDRPVLRHIAIAPDQSVCYKQTVQSGTSEGEDPP